MSKDEALKMAIEAMGEAYRLDGIVLAKAIQACKEALEQRDLYSEIKEGFDALKQPAQEPAYQVGEIVNPYGSNIKIKQPAQDWVGLSDDEIEAINKTIDPKIEIAKGKILFACAIEQALRERNCNDTK